MNANTNSISQTTPQDDTCVIYVNLVHRLITKQFPVWADLPIRPVEVGGWDNRTFRLGDNMLVRMPSAARYAAQVEKEHSWLPKLKNSLPISIPVPLAMGEPDMEYPWQWSIYQWLPGETAAATTIKDKNQFAMDLAQFIIALQKINTTSGPVPQKHEFAHAAGLHYYDAQFRQAVEILKQEIDTSLALQIWEKALRSRWMQQPVWVHGDISAGNLIIYNGKLSGVIDFGCLGVGDPACDIVIAWKFFQAQERQIFLHMLPLDTNTWNRGRAWALWKALIIKAGLVTSNPIENQQASHTIQEVLINYRDTAV